MKKQIPNLITLGNLLCGVLATLLASQGNLSMAALLICGGIFLDFFDGMAARLLQVASPLGKELDSLADVVTSGVAPGIILLNMTIDNPVGKWYAYLSLLMPLFAAYRLAKFNLDTRQSHSFIGLPVPANALIWVGMAPFAINNVVLTSWFPLALILLSIVTNILMISELPMFSLKFNFKNMYWTSNKMQYIFLLGCLLIIVVVFDWYALSLCIIWYIILSLITQKKNYVQ